MNTEERNTFWETLCSFNGSNPKEEMKMLKATIKFPRYLYRYRPVNMNNLEALRTNRLYFSSANYYDDPFDTYLHIDFDRVEKAFVKGFSDPDTLERIASVFREFAHKYEGTVLDDRIRMLSDQQSIKKAFFGDMGIRFLDYLPTIRNRVREDTWSVCFSENGINETLWLKYADQHKGFSLIYDMENDENLLCGTQEKCKNCCFKDTLPALYPIQYSNMPYDATDFAKIVILNTEMKNGNIPVLPEIIDLFGPAYWERERTTLIKKECHRYDEEWRMITWMNIKPPIMLEWIPHGVILGLRMAASERELVISLAKQAGIKHIFQSFINLNNQLDIREIF